MIEVTVLGLDPAPGHLSALEDLLSVDERRRAAAFHFARDRSRFVAARGQLRMLLAAHVGAPASTLEFRPGAHGKPALARPRGPFFNTSRSGEIGLCALSETGEVGCDIERLDPRLCDPDVARRFFAAAEVSVLERLPADQQLDGFFNCWTRKEAFVKALGLGLSHSLHAFCVSLAPGGSARFLGGAEGWAVASLDPAPGYRAAIAARGNAVTWRRRPALLPALTAP